MRKIAFILGLLILSYFLIGCSQQNSQGNFRDRDGFQRPDLANLTEEERQKMMEERGFPGRPEREMPDFESMTEEEREAFREQFQGRMPGER